MTVGRRAEKTGSEYVFPWARKERGQSAFFLGPVKNGARVRL
jgi:hypothetical protein